MTKSAHYLVEAIVEAEEEGAVRSVVGLHTDVLAQAMKRGQRMWDSGAYVSVAVMETRWCTGTARYVATGEPVASWRGTTDQAAA
jgi:hypothetical protein